MSAGARAALSTLLAAAAALLLTAVPAAAEPALPAGFQDEVAFPNLSKPTAVRFAPDGMVFVAEKNGKIEVYEDVEDETPELFKNLTVETYDHGDRGLLGLTVDPEFPIKPYVYALFTYDHVLGSGEPAPEWGTGEGDSCPLVPANEADDCVVSGRLVRYTANLSTDGEGHQHAAAGGEKVLIAEDWCQQFSSHSIGDLRFGPEGALYAGGGEGASFSSADYGQLGNPPNPCGDPEKEGGSLRSQDLRTAETGPDPTGLNGTIIRIDPETGKGWPGNPLADSASENEKRIVALGFRNPFRFALDPETGEIYVANVGSSEFEELDRFDPTAGSLFNSGWPCYEGANRHFLFKTFGLPICEGLYAQPQLVSSPLFYYSHKQAIAPGDECPYSSGSAIAGPAFYEGSEFPSRYKGALFFSDSVRGCIYAMLPGEDGRPDPEKIESFLTGGSLYPGVDIQEGPDGALYYASLFGEGFSKGAVHRISYAPDAPRARLTADSQYSADVEHEFHLDASGSSDPTDEALSFEWDLDGNGSFEASGDETKTVKYTEAKNVVVSVRVEDGQGLTNTAKLTLYPGDTPPVPTIAKPTEGTQWAVGDEIKLQGSAKNSKGESLEPLFLSWSTRVLHCPNLSEPGNCHSHPLQDFPGVLSATLIAPEHDYPSYIEITLTASDKRGLSASKTIKLPARQFVVHFASSPPGIPLTAGLVAQAAPFDVPSVEGSQLVVNAPPTYPLNGRTYTWRSWSDGGAISHTVIAKGTSTHTAVYTTPGEELDENPPPPVPQTRIKRHPRAKTTKTSATFVFVSTVADSRFRCKLDGKAKRPCRSPKTYRKLKPGKHTFKVWATAGLQTDPTPARFSWKILPRR